VGISCDTVYTLKAWADQLGGLNYPLCADYWPHGAVATAYGVFNAEIGRPERAIIVVDPAGIVRYIDVHQLREVPDDEAVHFAQELLDVFVEGGWPAHGVYRALPANVASTGLFVAVQDGDYPSEEERRLLLTLSEFGMYAVKSTSPKLTHPKAIELLVGHRPTM